MLQKYKTHSHKHAYICKTQNKEQTTKKPPKKRTHTYTYIGNTQPVQMYTASHTMTSQMNIQKVHTTKTCILNYPPATNTYMHNQTITINTWTKYRWQALREVHALQAYTPNQEHTINTYICREAHILKTHMQSYGTNIYTQKSTHHKCTQRIQRYIYIHKAHTINLYTLSHKEVHTISTCRYIETRTIITLKYHTRQPHRHTQSHPP